MNSTQRPQLGNGMSETEGKRRTQRKKKTRIKLERNFRSIDKSGKHRSLVLQNSTLFNIITQFFACTHIV